MIVAPFYGFDKNGVTKKTADDVKELKKIVNYQEDKTAYSEEDRANDVLKVEMNQRQKLTKPTWVNLPAAFSVDYATSMKRTGKLRDKSARTLLFAMDDLVAASKAEPN
ncbi:uncharacterized protein RCC_07161 [Ramularia collo-cygni]|uniref:Uncharacterized protein n=1 Tax=Ramularia collo-cygni TaxID=112498 RepID=A0A2D3V0J5_9PEZI|nr:uncharacterized protein RCC_07161 [Ramularia collo-cygni]CZT21298.1 uncharacterized protein RCC_07161 [Ramularia collo-cygni]